MLAQIFDSTAYPVVRATFALGAILFFASCATHPEPQLVSDGSAQESALPWNQQEKWENKGQFGPMAEQMSGNRR